MSIKIIEFSPLSRSRVISYSYYIQRGTGLHAWLWLPAYFSTDREIFVGVFLNNYSKLKEYTIDFPASDINLDCRLFETCISSTRLLVFIIEAT